MPLNDPNRGVVLCVLAGSLVAFSLGCAAGRSTARLRTASAPSLQGEDASIRRNLADPNAPFMLLDRTPRPSAIIAPDGDKTAPCSGESLSVSEIGAAAEGNARTVRLAFVNRGDSACTLAGVPAVTLLDQSGEPVAGIAIERKQDGSYSARVTDTNTAATTRVVLPPKGSAVFEISWETGPECPLINGVAISPPGINAAASGAAGHSFRVDRPLRVCHRRLSVSAIGAGQV